MRNSSVDKLPDYKNELYHLMKQGKQVTAFSDEGDYIKSVDCIEIDGLVYRKGDKPNYLEQFVLLDEYQIIDDVYSDTDDSAIYQLSSSRYKDLTPDQYSALDDTWCKYAIAVSLLEDCEGYYIAWDVVSDWLNYETAFILGLSCAELRALDKAIDLELYGEPEIE